MYAAKRFALAALVSLAPLFAACESSDPTASAIPVEETAQKTAPTSAIDPVTGLMVATNYPTNPVFINGPGASLMNQVSSVPEVCPVDDPHCYPPPECDPVFDVGCEPCDSTNPQAWCYCEPGVIPTFRTARGGVDPNNGVEVSSLAGTECSRLVVTGIGASVRGDSYYETLHVEYRPVNPDGSLGSPFIHRTGSNAYATPEAWVQLPTNVGPVGVVGIRVGQSGTQDVRTLQLWYRDVVPYSPTQSARMSGILRQAQGGANPYGPINAEVLTTNDNEVFVGVGLRSAVEQTKTVHAYIGQFR
ncbi:MAG: hypothetical protein ICV87_02160 [Gemmatimonadetes bacterium]|nr:hypothetical protein [Gemmatimonadota bacterium]